MPILKFYTLFHLNLAFSSIARDDYASLIKNCYTPILDLAERGTPVGIEATASTLIEIKRIDSGFIERFRSLCADKKAEFIGSGFSQLIMPLAPVEVNRWNLEAAGKYYKELLGEEPRTALVNEQTFSGGLVDLYLDAGYETLVMDWNNSSRYNSYPKEYLYYPQKSAGRRGEINILWSHSIAFQKFQRYIHGIISLEEYLEFIASQKAAAKDIVASVGPSVADGAGDVLPGFPLYGNDAEIFDFRPGDGARSGDFFGEWDKIAALYETFKGDESFELVLPSEFIDSFASSSDPALFNSVRLTSPETPLPCKKQNKYNPTRWAVTGRDSVHVNTECYRAFNNLIKLEGSGSIDDVTMNGLRERLCLLWGSDFRTNTTDEKLREFQNSMGWLMVETERLIVTAKSEGAGEGGGASAVTALLDHSAVPEGGSFQKAKVVTDKKTLLVESPGIRVEFLLNKGLSIKSLTFPELTEEPVIGTLPHGYFDDIHLGADFFSGHIINVQRDGRKVTDLSPVEPESDIDIDDGPESVRISAAIPLETGSIIKTFTLHKGKNPRLDINYRLKLNGLAASSLRLGIFSFFPTAFNKDSLWFESVNGGEEAERFYLKGRLVSHDEPVSSTVSASSCLGATDGAVLIGDDELAIRISSDKSELFSAPLLHYFETDEKYFLRLSHSIGEVDDTAFWVWRGINSISFTIEPVLEGDK